MVAPALGSVVLALPIFLLLQESYAAVLLAHALVGSLIGIFGGVYPAAFSELFPTNVRYSSLSISYSVSVSIFGGSAPLIFTFLLQRTDSPISPAFYVLLAGVISTIAAIMMPETAGEALKDVGGHHLITEKGQGVRNVSANHGTRGPKAEDATF